MIESGGFYRGLIVHAAMISNNIATCSHTVLQLHRVHTVPRTCSPQRNITTAGAMTLLWLEKTVHCTW